MLYWNIVRQLRKTENMGSLLVTARTLFSSVASLTLSYFSHLTKLRFHQIKLWSQSRPSLWQRSRNDLSKFLDLDHGKHNGYQGDSWTGSQFPALRFSGIHPFGLWSAISFISSVYCDIAPDVRTWCLASHGNERKWLLKPQINGYACVCRVGFSQPSMEHQWKRQMPEERTSTSG